MKEDLIDEHVRWILSIDRRLILMEYFKKNAIAKASDIAHDAQRSTQNISRALKEFEERELIECLTPSKSTWKKFILTDTGKAVMEKMDGEFI